MQVTVQVQGHLREFFPQLATPRPVELAGPTSVAAILTVLGVPLELPGAVLCGDSRVSLTFVPADGDRLTLLSPMSGG